MIDCCDVRGNQTHHEKRTLWFMKDTPLLTYSMWSLIKQMKSASELSWCVIQRKTNIY